MAQQWKLNGKEFNEDLGVNFYEMDLRQYDVAIARWVAIDPITHHNQSTYAAFDNNPVFWADPSGAATGFGGAAVEWLGGGAGASKMGNTGSDPDEEEKQGDTVIVTGSQSKDAVSALQSSVSGELKISSNSKGILSYSRLIQGPLTQGAQMLADAIDSKSITVNIDATNNALTKSGLIHDTGGVYSGNTIGTSLLGPLTGDTPVSTQQEVNVSMLTSASNYYKTPGKNMLHEANESYEGGLQAQSSGMSSGNSNTPGNSYNLIHGRANIHSPQTPYYVDLRDANGNITKKRTKGAIERTFVIQKGRQPLIISTITY